LPAEVLERLGTAAYLVGREAEAMDLLVSVHNEYLNRGQTTQAVRAAFWLGFALQGKGSTREAVVGSRADAGCLTIARIASSRAT
jgi:hypothetical protein